MNEALLTQEQERKLGMGLTQRLVHRVVRLFTKESVEITPAADLDTYDLNISAEAAARAIDCHVVRPESNQLQLDIDNEEAFNTYMTRVVEYMKHSGLTVAQEVHDSKSGHPNRHVTLTITDVNGNPHIFDEWERLALQFALGSDPVRETLNSWRLLTGSSNPSRLFEPND